MIALSVAKLKIFSPESEIVTLFGKTGLNENCVVMHFECVDNAF